MNEPGNPDDELAILERRAAEATRSGRQAEAQTLWARVLALQPGHLPALTQTAQAAYRAGDWHGALAAFQRAAQVEPGNPRRWVDLAMTHERLGDGAAQEHALFEALRLDPRNLMALLLRGGMHEARKEHAQAASAYGAALAVAQGEPPPRGPLQAMLEHAARFSQRHQETLASFVEDHLAQALREVGRSAMSDRFQLSLDILLGRKQRHDSQPLVYYYPKLQPVEFFDRARFPWLDPIEAGWEGIRDEFLAVLREDQGFVPYVQYNEDQPLDQWAGLNHNPAWSVYHLVSGGEPVAEHAARCPHTMGLWSAHVPAPRQAGRTPVALFSLLKPHTHIPPHTGASNVRLLVHLPLIVPPRCRFRVGNSVREWVPGNAWAFDDTIEHEAWNDSDQLRVVMIFDHWHPDIPPEERFLISALGDALNLFGQAHGRHDRSVDYAR